MIVIFRIVEHHRSRSKDFEFEINSLYFIVFILFFIYNSYIDQF
jgi:hypothetical protein